MTPNMRKVLVVAPNWLGDAVMSLPAIGMLGAADGVHTTVLTNPYTERVYRGIAAIDEVITLPKDGPSRRMWARAAALRRGHFDGVVLFTPSFSSALTVASAGIRHRVGYRADGRSWLLSRRLPSKQLRGEHVSDNYQRLAQNMLDAIGARPSQRHEGPALQVFDEERARLARTLEKAGVRGPYAVVVPGAVFGPTKKWPPERFRSVVAGLSSEIDVILTGTESDRDVCDYIAADQARAHNLAGQTDLGQFFALLADARLVVANDSGAPHVSASLGVPTVVIFGSTSPTWTRPLGRTVEVIREPVHCSPCFRAECPTQLECLTGISADRVVAAGIALLGNARRTGAGSERRG